MAKKMKFRKAARLARDTGKNPFDTADKGGIPDESIPQTAIPVEDTIAIAKGGEETNRGNSNKQPLSPVGEQSATETAGKIAAKGGLDDLRTSTALRAEQTADAIGGATGQHAKPEAGLESWAQGNLEGQPAASVKRQIRDLVKRQPQYRVPGQGAISTRPGESFDDFRKRALPVIRAAMEDLAHNPKSRIGIVLHSQTIRLLRSWIDAGMPDDYSVNPEKMLDDAAGDPGTVERLFPVREQPHWSIEPVDLDAKGELPPGSIYLIRHGMTESNKENYQKGGDKQEALANMVKHVKSMDFGRARAFARKASQEHGVGDDEIGSMIDGALPDAETAGKLPHHQLLAVASAAGPSRRNEYSKILRERFGDLGNLSPDAQRELQAHLAQLGMAS